MVERSIVVIETEDQRLLDRLDSLLPGEDTLSEVTRTAYFEAEVESEAPLGYFCKQICEALEATSETC